MHVETFCNGDWAQNCYVLVNPADDAVIIDPGSEHEKLINLIEENNWRPLAVLNTHAHFDHVGAIAPILETFDIPFYMHSQDGPLLRQANMYKMLFGARESIRIPAITHDLENHPAELNIDGFELSWVATPGHTPGGVCFRCKDHLFTGDTLLSTGVGRSDLPGGNKTQLGKSISVIAALPQDLTIWAGHGSPVSLFDALAIAKTSQL